MTHKTYTVGKCISMLLNNIPCIYTVSGKNALPKYVKITLWIENDSHYFYLCDEKPSIYNVCVKFHDN